MDLLPAEIIRQKRDGKEIPTQVLRDFILGFAGDLITDYQMAAFMMAVYFRGMSDRETKDLVQAIIDSGHHLLWSGHPRFLVDKHSTGGIGDKTSMIVGPLVAAAGLSVPMMAGRGLGHTGGTLDKLESIPGFSVNLSLKKFEEQVLDLGLAFIGQSHELCPADKKLYALRDVTGTVESLPLVCGSILSKKLAEGIQGLVLDVKFGSGAFFKSYDSALELGKALKKVGEGFGPKITVCLSNMDQPLGRFAGNSLEIFECLEILSGKSAVNSQGVDLYQDTRDLSIHLAAEMLLTSGKYKSQAEAAKRASEILSSGQALEKWKQVCLRQGGFLNNLPKAEFQHPVVSTASGFISRFNTEKIGYLNIKLGAGRTRLEDSLDLSSGIEFHLKVGHAVKTGDPLVTLHGSDLAKLKSLEDEVRSLISISPSAVPQPDLIRSILR